MTSSSQHTPSSSTQSSQHHPPIDYKFPDPTDISSRQADSLIESPISSPRITAQSDTDWSILSINPNPELPPPPTTTSDQEDIQPTTPPLIQPQLTVHQELPASMPPLEDQDKCQQWIENLPAGEITEKSMIESFSQTVLPNINQANSADNSQFMDSSQYTTELGPNDSASQCVYHRPTPTTNHILSNLPTSALHPIVESVERPAEYPLDPSMDLSSAYLTPTQFSSNLEPNPAPFQAPTPPSSIPKIAPKPPSSALSSHSSASSPPTNRSASKPTSSTIIPPKISLSPSPAQAPEPNKNPPRYPIKIILFLLLSTLGVSSFIYRLFYSPVPPQDPLTRGPDEAEKLFQATEPHFAPISRMQEEDPFTTSPKESPPVVLEYARPSQEEQILLSRDEIEQVQDLESPSPQDIDQLPMQSTHAVSTPEEVSESNHLLVDPLTALADPIAVAASNEALDAIEDKLESDSDQSKSPPTDRPLPTPNYASLTLMLAIIGPSLFFLMRSTCSRERPGEQELLSLDQLLSGLDSQSPKDCPRSVEQLEQSLEKISQDEQGLKRMTNALKSRQRIQLSPQVDLGLLAWTKAAQGDDRGAQIMWKRFWADEGQTTKPVAHHRPSIWLPLVEELGRAYEDRLCSAPDDDASSSATLTPHPPSKRDPHQWLKPEPDASPDPPQTLVDPSSVPTRSKRIASPGSARLAPRTHPNTSLKQDPDAPPALPPPAPVRKTRRKSSSTALSSSVPPPLPPARSARKSEPLVGDLGGPVVRSSPRLRTKLERKIQ